MSVTTTTTVWKLQYATHCSLRALSHLVYHYHPLTNEETEAKRLPISWTKSLTRAEEPELIC